MSIKQKLNSRSGFTLAETLLAVLVLLLVSTIVAAGIPVAQKAYVNVVIGSNAQALLSTTAAALRDELGSAWGVEPKDGGLTYYSADTGAKSIIKMDSDTIMLQEYVIVDGFNEGEGSSGDARPLVSERASTADLSVSYEGVSCVDGVVTFNKLSVKTNDGDELAGLDALTIRVFSWKPTPTPGT